MKTRLSVRLIGFLAVLGASWVAENSQDFSPKDVFRGTVIPGQSQDSSPLEVEYATQALPQELFHSSWNFLGCSRSPHECQHEAERHGYHHHRVVQDHHRCRDHRPYACYGRN
jgi:hypothetical protein